MEAMSTNNRTKQRRSGGLSLLLFQRALHPELFKILGSEQVVRRAYESDIWLVEGGHVVTFVAGKTSLVEVIVTGNEQLPDRNLIQSLQCRFLDVSAIKARASVRPRQTVSICSV